MNLTDEITTVGKEKATRIKAFLEELELQMALGKAEARDAFKEEKKNFEKFLDKYKTQVHGVEDESLEHVHELNMKFANLLAKVNLKFPDTKRKFDKFKNESLHAIFELEVAMKATYGEVKPDMQARLDVFKDKLDAYRIQLAFADYKEEEKLQARKNELTDAINEIRDKLQEQEEAGTKLEHFVEDVSDSFEKMKKAFSDMFA
jgi:uncharacterized protein YoxC